MKIKKLFSAGFSALFAVSLVLIAAEMAGAQGRYANRYSKRDVSNIISRMETASDSFRRDFDRAMDNSNLNGSAAEDRFNNIVRDFENSVDRLRRDFDRNDSWWESRNNVQSMIRDASPVNTMMVTLPFRRNIENQWRALRTNINTVADTYDLPGLNGGGWSGGGGGGWGGGGQTITPPNWAQGVFYGRAPDGSQITLTVSRNGSVNANINGAMSYGTFTSGNYLNIGGAIARVTRQGNGILTSRTDNGERISYSRSGWGDGGGNPGNQISPPGWARGTFYGTAPDGSRITLTISSNGAVTVEIGGNMSYGSFTQGNVLSINGAYARVTSISRGIRTVRTDTGETINYRR